MAKAPAKKTTKSSPKKTTKSSPKYNFKMSHPISYEDYPPYPDWVRFTVSISPEVLAKAKLFSKKNTLRMSQLVNSSVKVFISEAEEYIADQERAKSMWPSERQKVTPKTKAFRISKVFSTEDAMKAHKLSPSAYSPFVEDEKKRKK